MKKVLIILPLIAAFLVSTHVWGQNNANKKERGTATMTKETGSSRQNPKSKKILVVYFSHSGNTREIANQIHSKTGGDLFEIQTVQTYPQNYDAVVKQARKELDSGYKPELKSKMKNVESYDMIFVGYPNWWGTIPMPFVTFFSEYNFSGKTIIPFCTHEGSGLGRSVTDIKKLCPQSTILEGLAIRGGSVKGAQGDVASWLHRIGITE